MYSFISRAPMLVFKCTAETVLTLWYLCLLSELLRKRNLNTHGPKCCQVQSRGKEKAHFHSTSKIPYYPDMGKEHMKALVSQKIHLFPHQTRNRRFVGSAD